MERKTIIAFALIFAAIFLFNSEFYYHKILRKPHPKDLIRQKQAEQAKRLKEMRLADSLSKPDSGGSLEKIVTPAPPPLIEKMPETSEIQPLSHAAARLKPIIVETPLFICRIERIGAIVSSWKMKGYQSPRDTGGFAELVPSGSAGALNLTVGRIALDSLAFSCAEIDSADSLVFINGTESVRLSFACELGDGGRVEKVLTFYADKWDFDLAVKKHNLGVGKLKLGWLGGIRAVDADPNKPAKRGSGPGSYAGFLLWGEDVEEADDFEEGLREYTGSVGWVGAKEGYFGCAIILPKRRDASVEFKQEIKDKMPVQMTFEISEDFEAQDLHYTIFAGPLKHAELKSYGVVLEKMIFQGYTWFVRADIWFPVLCGFVTWLLNFFYSIVPDYGVSIILLTIISRIIMIPLTQKSQKSMSAMKDLQPKMTDIRAKYKADQVRMNQELMKLYKKHGVSPMGAGCLPMFLQMPVFISLFISLRKAVELRGAETFLFWITDLSKPDAIIDLPMALPFYGEHVCLLPILMAVATFFQNKMTIKDPNQKMMVYFMPIFFLFLFNSFPAGLNLYWTLSTLIGILQQVIIERNKKKKQLIQSVVT